MSLPQKKSYTIEDIYALPDETRAELIDGQIYYMTPPTTKHQRIVSFLHLNIAQYIFSKKGQCEVFPAPFAIHLNQDDKNHVEPDLSIICDPNKLDDKGCKGAPDWVIEIVSPSSRRMDYYTKLFKYRTSGVREYWIVDPDRNRILVYNFESDDINDFSFSDSVKAGIYDDLYIDFSQLNIEM